MHGHIVDHLAVLAIALWPRLDPVAAIQHYVPNPHSHEFIKHYIINLMFDNVVTLGGDVHTD